MSLNSYKALAVSAISLLTLAGSAQATLFSFASDDDSNAFTFRGTASTGTDFMIRNARDPLQNLVTLKIDDNNLSGPTVALDVGFLASFSVTYQGSVGFAGLQTHTYAVAGSFSFVDRTTGAALLTGTIGAATPAVMTILGNGTSWGSAGSIFGSDSAANVSTAVQWTATPALVTLAANQGFNLSNYGIIGGQASNLPDDFSFTLTALAAATGGAVPINAQTRLPTASWLSEGSFSGTALTGIPTPGAVSLLGLAGLMAMSRRRRD